MRIGLHDADGHNFPNLALMKLSAHHKRMGDTVERYMPLADYDKVYSSKVFTWTSDGGRVFNAECGGTGYKLYHSLPNEIEHIMPDYSLYDCKHSLGFLTRGCPNKCCWCIVPQKEGDTRAHADVEEFTAHKDVVLMDNNVLAHEHGISQIEKISRLGLRVDFNQGIDARRIDDQVARLLSKVNWMSAVRLACDSSAQMPHIQNAVTLLRWHNVTPRAYFVYVLVKDIEDAIERVKFLKGLNCDPFAQPYRDFSSNTEPTKEQKQFARWVNHKAIFKSTTWDEYKRAS